jgi:murein DD-endopeptidase MepM/ murein hydrolase activator NlpD
MSVLGAYFDHLIQEVLGLFGAGKRFNQPGAATRPTTPSNFIGSPGGYQAPIHGTWASSGGFTYQPNATHPTGHMGVDMRAAAGTPVYPLTDGVVSNVGTDPKGGNVVNVHHASGVTTYYAHLSTAKVQKGDKVSVNTELGTVGNTGNASHTFPHLHFQVWKDGQIQDPAAFFSVPAYTNLSPQERANPWVSEQAKQEAQAFNMREHTSERRVAFTRDVDKLVKLADQYYRAFKS